MGLLSHLWHVINREIIAGSLQWLETTQIPGNDASVPTPRPHFSLCLPVPCSSHTRNKARWRHKHRWPPATWKLLDALPDLAFPPGGVHSHRAHVTVTVTVTAWLLRVPSSWELSLGRASISIPGTAAPCPCPVPRAAHSWDTAKPQKKEPIPYIYPIPAFSRALVLYPGESHTGSFLVSVPLKASLGFAVTSWPRGRKKKKVSLKSFVLRCSDTNPVKV